MLKKKREGTYQNKNILGMFLVSIQLLAAT